MLLAQIKNLNKKFQNQTVLNNINFEIETGQILALAGESGCGKSTIAKILAGLLTADSGQFNLNKLDFSLVNTRPKTQRKKVQLVFQNSLASFNPKYTIYQSLTSPLEEYEIVKKENDLKDKIAELFELVGLNDLNLMNRFPHQLSGGQIQRAAIARAICCEPDLLIADEPTSALDVSIRAQILSLFRKLTLQKNFACLIISHDLLSLKNLADQICIMRAGEIIERGFTKDILNNPTEKYTQKLIAAIPTLNPEDQTFYKFANY
jgi:peptide/nickel transport system ATP-binding protein